MALSAEQITVIRSSLDPSGYKAGAEQIVAANQQIAASGETVAQAQTKTTRALTDNGSAFERLKRQIDPAYAAAQQYARTQEVLARSVETGRATQEDANRLLLLAQQRFGTTGTAAKEMGVSAGNTAFAVRQLGVQSIQAISSIASGMPVMTTFIQQGHQVVDVALSTGTGFEVVGTAIKRAVGSVNPYVAAAVLATAAMAALGAAAESSARRIEALQNSLRGTRDDYTAMAVEADLAAKHLAATTNISTADARSATGLIAAAPQFQGTQAQMEALVRVAENMAITLGETLPDAAKLMAKAMGDPAAVIQDMTDRRLKGFNQQLADAVKLQQQAGDKAGAFGLFLDAMKVSTHGAAENLTPLQQALHDLSQAFTKTGQDGRSLADALGSAITSAAAGAINAITAVVRGIESLRQTAANGANAIPVAPGYTGTTGSVLTSDKGAMGIFQLMPDTAAGLHVNPADPTQNIYGGLTYIQQLLASSRGDVNQALTQYGGFKTKDPAAYIAAVQDADTSVLDNKNVRNGSQTMTVAQAIDFWGQTLGLSPDVIALGKRIATVESGGSQFQTEAAKAAAIATPVPPTPPETAPGAPPTTGLVNTDAVNDARKLVTSLNLVSDAQARIAAQRQALQAGLDAATLAGNQEDIDRFTKGLQALAGEYYRTTSPQEEFVRGLELQGETASIVTEGDRRVAETLRQIAELDRQHPEDASTAEQRARAMNVVLTEQFGAYKVLSHDLDVQISAQQKLSAAYDQGYDHVARATAETQAFEAALKLFPTGSAQFQAAVTSLTEKFLALSRAQGEARIAQQIAANDNQIQYIEAETASLGMNNDARNLMLARLRAEQELKQLNIPLESELGQAYLTSADRVTRLTSAFDKQKATLDDVANSFAQSFDTIGNAISQSLVTGKAVDWGNVMSSVAQQVLNEFLKLAVINPLLNSIFGSNRSTLFDMFGSGGGGTSGGGGLFGLLGNLFGGGSDLGAAGVEGFGAMGTAPADMVSSFGMLGMVHTGGEIGRDALALKPVALSVLTGAPRFHSGLNSDEFAAILQRGERVLTANQNNQFIATMKGLSAQGERRSSQAPTIVFNITTPNADSFQRSQAQIMARAGAMIGTAQRRNG